MTVVPTTLFAQNTSAQKDTLQTLLAAYIGANTVSEARVTLAVAPLVDNGNSVPVEVTVDSPMTAADHVVSIAIFNEKNPQPNVAEFILTSQTGRAQVATRIRLSTTQKLVAIAKMNDGRCYTHTVEVLVTLAACIEE